MQLVSIFCGQIWHGDQKEGKKKLHASKLLSTLSGYLRFLKDTLGPCICLHEQWQLPVQAHARDSTLNNHFMNTYTLFLKLDSEKGN